MINNGQPIVPPQDYWRKKYPAIISGILSVVQFIVSILIIACEVGSILIDMITATIYVGLWSGLFFLLASISQAISSCCCRRCGFATYTLIIQLIAMFFALCVIGFDSLFIYNSKTCFFPTSQCNSTGTARGLFYSTSNFENIKMTTIKVQLAFGCVMWLLCFIYILIYIITNIRVYRAKRPANISPLEKPPFPTYAAAPNGVLSAPPVKQYVPPMPVPQTSSGAILLACPTCSSGLNMTATKRLPM